MTRQVLVIGAGPAGIEAARAAAMAGAQVTLVSEGAIGGRAGWHSLLPSKVWLAAAEAYGFLAEAQSLGVALAGPARADPPAVLVRIREVASAWNKQAQAGLEGLGVRLLAGTAAFESPAEVSVTSESGAVAARLVGDAIIVATGSVPRFTADMRPDGRRVLAPRFAGRLKGMPPDILVIGGGATGSEFAYLFNRLGVRVTWLVSPRGVLPQFAPDAGRFLGDVLSRRGVRLVVGPRVAQVKRHTGGVSATTEEGVRHRASAAFLAVGRLADTARLNLRAAGLQPGPAGELQTDLCGGTAVPGIYAVGDVTGEPMLANQAMAQAWIAGRHAAGMATAPFRPETVVQAVYTEPQVAQVGAVQGQGPAVGKVHMPFAAGLKAHLVPEAEGFVELAFDTRDGRVLGGLAVCPHAADLLAPVAVAIQLYGTIGSLAATGCAHPTVSELAFLAARAAHGQGEGEQA